jgi:hypothetical protein
MRVVEFANGKFAVKKGWWIFAEYSDVKDRYWWSIDRHIITFALFDTKEAACERMRAREEIDNKLELKIIKTHKCCKAKS